MQSRLPPNSREPRLYSTNIRDFNFSLDVKGFAKQHNNSSPFRINNNKPFYKISAEKGKTQAPTPLAAYSSFSKNVSYKNIPIKKRRLSGLNITKSNNHSVSLDKHLIKHKYDNIKELFDNEKYEKVIPQIKHIILHFQYSNAQKNLFLWLVFSRIQLNQYEQGIEQAMECISLYPQAYEGYLYAGKIHFKLKNYRQSIQAFQKAIKIDNKNQQGYLQLALCYRLMEEMHKSIQTLKKAHQKLPKSNEILLNLVQYLVQDGKIQQSNQYFEKASSLMNRKDSIFLYLRGLSQKTHNNINEAYILFEQALKYNNSKSAVTKSLLQILRIEIDQRDFYKAHHTISRSKFLDIEVIEEIALFAIFVQGVIMMMKKKFKEALQILHQALSHEKVKHLKIEGLIYKYLGYGYFKEGEHEKSIKYYKKLSSEEKDESSNYNLLLAEGIELVDKSNNFEAGINKFQNAKKVYPQKVQPFIYIAMSIIRKSNISHDKDEVHKAQAMIDALRELEQGYAINSSSSNLLYHRTILHLFFEDWEESLKDINRCIEKAEQNLPKYFYLRGVCYSCVKEFKKAINQFSICISLSPSFSLAYLEKSKCSFLLGDTDKGFSSLKTFMEMNPDDLTIYRWIGDLLYEGESYRDALKAYSELGPDVNFEALIMQLKCIFRVGSLNEIANMMKVIEKGRGYQKEKLIVDNTAMGIIQMLVKGENSKQLALQVKKLNKFLEENCVGYLFQLIDCMNLLGVASFYLQKYTEAYESFLLVLELFKSLSSKSISTLKSESSEQNLDLKIQDIYLNVILCEFAQGNTKEAIRLIEEEYYESLASEKSKKIIEKLIKNLQKVNPEGIELDQRYEKPINSKLKKVQIVSDRIKIKSKPSFNLYHDCAVDIYASSVAQKMVDQLHAGYIDNMPEGPWIKRNTFGVIFTQQILPSEDSVSFEDTARVSESKQEEEAEEIQDSSFVQKSKKTDFLKKLQFDKDVEAKLNRIIENKQKSS